MEELDKDKKPSTTKNQNTLTNFIEQNQKIISVLGVFTALTVFTANLSFRAFGYALSFIFLSLTLLLWIEVLEKFPKGEANWRLKIFEILLSYTFLGIILYWLLSYREIWHSVMYLPVSIILATIFTSIVTWPIKKYDLFNIIFRTKPTKRKFIRYTLYLIIILGILFISVQIANIISPPINALLVELREKFIKWVPQS